MYDGLDDEKHGYGFEIFTIGMNIIPIMIHAVQHAWFQGLDEQCPYIGTGTPGDVAALALSCQKSLPFYMREDQ